MWDLFRAAVTLQPHGSTAAALLRYFVLIPRRLPPWQMDPDQHENMELAANPVTEKCDTCNPHVCSECIICGKGCVTECLSCICSCPLLSYVRAISTYGYQVHWKYLENMNFSRICQTPIPSICMPGVYDTKHLCRQDVLSYRTHAMMDDAPYVRSTHTEKPTTLKEMT